jgi:hypothetical protein
MKKLYTFILSGALGFGAFGQATKLVLVEAFSNASCPPCAANNPQMNALLDNNTSKAVSVKYQANFPGFDPMNQQNPGENNARRNYYGVNAVPGVMVEGVTGPINSASINQSHIDNPYNAGTPLDLSVAHTITNNFNNIEITVTANNLGTTAITGNLVLHVALVEKEINFPEPPGTTSEKDFYNVMRKMYPNENGTTISGGLSPGMPQTFTLSHTIPNYIYNYGELAVVAWVQDVTTKEVFNAALSSPAPLPSNAVDAGVQLTGLGYPLCATSIEPQVELVNNGNVAITSATVSYSLNGGAPVDFSFTGNLSANNATLITFPTATLPGGTSEIVYTVSNVNNGAFDFNTMNNSTPTEQIAIIDPSPVAAPLIRGFESVPNFELPSDLIFQGDLNGVFVVDQNAVQGLNWELGGFGASSKSLLIDFYTKSAGEVVEIITPKVNMSTAPGLYVSFNYAHAQYQSSDDFLAFEASRDCGENWETIWSSSGSNLATAPPSNNRFFPNHSSTNTDWRKIPLFMSSYSNDTEVIFRFRAVSDFGNTLWIDDINIGGASVSVEEIAAENGIEFVPTIEVFPNPARDIVSIKFELDSESNIDVQIVNALGQNVVSQSYTNQDGSVQKDLAISHLAAGMYNVFIMVNGERTVKKLTVY